MNTKSFDVTVEVKLDRNTWRKLGYGDQPSKAEVTYVFASFLDAVRVEGSPNTLHVKYMGGPGHYLVTLNLEVEMPWWRRAGYGDRVSKAEVTQVFKDLAARVASQHIVTVN